MGADTNDGQLSSSHVKPLLVVSELCKEYHSDGAAVRALDGLSLAVGAGEFAAIMGASGSGKSTLLHLIAGLAPPTSGAIEIAGHDVARMSDRERTLFRRRRIGLVFQAYNLLPTLSAVENVALPALLDGLDEAATLARAKELLDLVGLGHRLSHRPQALSGGEQQRVAIARALINDPLLLLADEPTGNVDSQHALAIWRLLARLVREKGCTVTAVTHDAAGASHAHRVIVLKDGRVVGQVERIGDGDASMVASRYAELVG